jgi:hypothetical protein
LIAEYLREGKTKLTIKGYDSEHAAHICLPRKSSTPRIFSMKRIARNKDGFF